MLKTHLISNLNDTKILMGNKLISFPKYGNVEDYALRQMGSSAPVPVLFMDTFCFFNLFD